MEIIETGLFIEKERESFGMITTKKLISLFLFSSSKKFFFQFQFIELIFDASEKKIFLSLH